MGRKENLKKAKEDYKNIMKEISSSKERWKEFLEFSSRFYKYSFTENLLMFSNNPNVTMCATLEEWNSIGRWVKPHSTSIKILRDTENDVSLDYVFDVSDTYARKGIVNAYTDEKLKVFQWTATEDETIKILKDYFKNDDANNLEQLVIDYIADSLDESNLLNNLSDEEEMQVLKPDFWEFITKNITYQISNRCGFNIENENDSFLHYEEFSNPVAINVIGNCLNYCTSDLLKIVEYKIKKLKREELKNATRKIWNNNKEKYEGTISNEIQRIDNRNNIDGEIIGERAGSIETTRDNNEEITRTKSSTEDERIYSNGTIQSTDREYDGRVITTDVGRKDLDDKEVEKNNTSFSFAQNAVSDEFINKILTKGGNVANSVTGIKDILNNESLSTKEQAEAIKNEYGDAGTSNQEFYWESRAKGLKIVDKETNAEINLSWIEVVKRMQKIFNTQNQQLGFETLFNLSYQQDEIIEEKDNSKYEFINDLIEQKIKLNDREYKVSRLDLENSKIELYDLSVKGWYPLFREMDLDEFVLEYSKTNNIKQNEEIIVEISKESSLGKLNYEMSNEFEKRSLQQRAKDNIKAIKLLKEIEIEDRFATKEEQEILAKYSGWGGLSQVFDPKKAEWQVEEIELRENLTQEEYAEARASSLNAFYTNADIIDSMYLGLERLGFKGRNILEPSARNRKFHRKIAE